MAPRQAIVEQAADAMIFVDRDGLIRVWNRGAESLFGFAAAEVLGTSVDVIIPERLRAAHWRGFHAAIDSGRTKSGGRATVTRALRKDGGKLYVELRFSLVKDPAGAVLGALAIGREKPA